MTAEAATYRRALKATALVLGALAIIAAPVGWLVAGGAGLLAGVVGVAVAALAGLTTQAAMVIGHNRAPHMMAAIVLGSWLAKMVIIVIALLVLQGIEGFHRGLFAAFLLVGVVATLVVDFWAVRAARIPYVDPGSK